MMISDLMPEFRDYLEHERKLSPQTLINYLNDMKLLQSHLPGTEVELIQEFHLRSWMREMSRSGLSVATIHRRIATSSTFFNWLRLEKYIDESPCERLVLPKKREVQPNYLTEEQYKRFVHVMPNSRYGIAWLLLAWLGLRRGEVLRLKWQDVRLDERIAIIRETKSKKDRVLPLSEKLVVALQKAYERRNSDYVVSSVRGEPLIGYTFYRHFKSHARRCGLPEWVKPHTIRHSFATHLIRSGVGIDIVKQMMGHKSINTTMIYIHHSPDLLRAAMEKNVLNLD